MKNIKFIVQILGILICFSLMGPLKGMRRMEPGEREFALQVEEIKKQNPDLLADPLAIIGMYKKLRNQGKSHEDAANETFERIATVISLVPEKGKMLVKSDEASFDDLVYKLFESRDKSKGMRRFFVTLPNNRRVENIVIQLPTINQFNESEYLDKIKDIISQKGYETNTCPAMSIRSAHLLHKYFEGKNPNIVNSLKSYSGAIHFVDYLEKKHETRTTDCTGNDILEILKKFSKQFGLRLKDNVTVLESVGAFDKLLKMVTELSSSMPNDWRTLYPEISYLDEELDVIKTSLKNAKDGFRHAFILGTLDRNYYDVQIGMNHWFCVFVAKVQNQYYWFVVDSAGANNLDPHSIEYARIRYLIEGLFDAKNKLNYENMYQRYHNIQESKLYRKYLKSLVRLKDAEKSRDAKKIAIAEKEFRQNAYRVHKEIDDLIDIKKDDKILPNVRPEKVVAKEWVEGRIAIDEKRVAGKDRKVPSKQPKQPAVKRQPVKSKQLEGKVTKMREKYEQFFKNNNQ